MTNFDQVNSLLAYEPDTGLLRWKVSRGSVKAGRAAGSVDSHGYLRVRVHDKLYGAHRLAWLLSTGAWPSQQIDHIDGCRTNNRLDNLRECNKSENGQNMCKYSNNTSGVPGVNWLKQEGKWQVRIAVDGERISLGLFETLEEAAQARAAAKAEFHQFQPTDRS